VSDEKVEQKGREPEGLLASTARGLGHAAGVAARSLGSGEANAPKLPGANGGSGRARRIAEAATVKEAAARLGKNALIDDARYRRIVGKKPAIWSREDVDYVAGLVSSKSGAGESPAR
jgi:hypothetical protein